MCVCVLCAVSVSWDSGEELDVNRSHIWGTGAASGGAPEWHRAMMSGAPRGAARGLGLQPWQLSGRIEERSARIGDFDLRLSFGPAQAARAHSVGAERRRSHMCAAGLPGS